MNEAAFTRDRLLLGVFSWRMGYISQPQLAEAMRGCLTDESRSMRMALVELGFVSDESADRLEQMLADQLAHHDGDVEASWASLTGDDSTINSLLDDTDDPAIERGAWRIADDDSVSGVLPLQGQLRVLGLHAEGGLGRVHRASDEVLGREVALKEVRPDLADRPAARQRFVQEAQITGRLEHPGIVPVYGLGTGPDGRPYYAMRMVEGETLTEGIRQFHEARQKSTGSAGQRKRVDFDSVEFRGLLDRLIDVAQAVRYAHSRGVLHRDLKPDNILLGEYGETLVIDWGLARQPKASNEDVSGRTGASMSVEPPLIDDAAEPTRGGHLLGTVGYAPPEQLDGRVERITERSDVYALGAVLYQLLVGHPPIHNANGRPMRELVEQTLAGDITPPRQLDATIPKPLAAISMRALARQPEDRYALVEELIDELDRWKAYQPIQSAPESWGDRVARLSRRYRTAALATACALVAIAVVATGSLLVVNQARLEEADARQQAQHLAEEKSELALDKTRLADRNQRVVDSFVAAFRSPNPNLAGVTSSMTAAEVLEQALARLEQDSELADDPLSKATLLEAIGSSLMALGSYDQAISCFATCRDLRQPALGAEHPETLTAAHNLGIGYTQAGQLQQAVPLLENTLAARERALAADDELLLNSMTALAEAYQAAGRLNEAVQLYEETLKLRAATLGADHPDTLAVTNNLATAYELTGHFNKALDLYKTTFAAFEKKLGSDHPETLAAMGNLVTGYRVAGQLQEALSLGERALELSEAKLGPQHPATLMNIMRLANCHHQLGQLEQAAELYQQMIKEGGQQLGVDHPQVFSAMNNLAITYKSLGQFDEAVAQFDRVLQLRREKLGADHHETLSSMHNLATMYRLAGRVEDSLTLLEQTCERREATLGADHPLTLQSMRSLATTYRLVGRLEDAVQMLERAYEVGRAKLGDDHVQTWLARHGLAKGYLVAGRVQEAIELFEQVAQYRESKLGADHPETLMAQANLAAAYDKAGRGDEALAINIDVLRCAEAKLGADHPHTLSYMNNVATGYRKSGQLDKSLELLERALQLRQAKLGPDHPETLESLSSLAVLHQAAGRHAEAARVAEEVLELRLATLGSEHLDTWKHMQNLGVMRLELGQLEQARELFDSVLASREENFGAAHPATLTTRRSLFETLLQLGKYDRALQIAVTWLTNCRQANEVKEIDVGVAALSVAEANIELGQHQAAAEHLAAAREVDELDWIQQSRADSLQAAVLVSQQKCAEAELLAESAAAQLVERLDEIPVHFRWIAVRSCQRAVAMYESCGKPSAADEWRTKLAQLRQSLEPAAMEDGSG